MELILWKDFSKRKNSTKIPDTAGTTFDIVLKEDTDMENPVIVLEPVDLGYTYAKFNNNYYFVDSEIVLTKNLMQLSLSMDSLASNKVAIGNTNAFIAYSSTGYDTMQIDNRVASKVTKTITTASASLADIFDADGCYILSVANRQSTGKSGFACQYVLDQSALGGFADALMNPTFREEIMQFFSGTPLQSIISCTWLPTKYAATHGTVDRPLEFGGSVLGTAEYFVIANFVYLIKYGTITIPWTYNDYRRNPPYTTMSLLVPFYGIIEINPSDVIDCTNLYYKYTVDITSGDVILELRRDSENGARINTLNFNIGVSCPVAQTSSNMGGVVSGATGVVGGLGAALVGVASENALAVVGGLGAAAMSASNAALSANTRTTSSRGSINGRSTVQLGFSLILYVYSQDTENPDESDYINTYGRPVMHNDTINNHSGYIQCANASFAGSVLSGERDQINSYLNSGFYYE